MTLQSSRPPKPRSLTGQERINAERSRRGAAAVALLLALVIAAEGYTCWKGGQPDGDVSETPGVSRHVAGLKPSMPTSSEAQPRTSSRWSVPSPQPLGAAIRSRTFPPEEGQPRACVRRTPGGRVGQAGRNVFSPAPERTGEERGRRDCPRSHQASDSGKLSHHDVQFRPPRLRRDASPCLAISPGGQRPLIWRGGFISTTGAQIIRARSGARPSAWCLRQWGC